MFNQKNFSVNTAHCSNSVQDNDETDVDCGGVSCDACVTASKYKRRSRNLKMWYRKCFCSEIQIVENLELFF